MAVTLAQLAKIETDPLRKMIMANILREVKVFEVLPFENVNSLKTVAVRYRTLPSVAWRKINAGYTASEGDTEQVWESVYGFGGDINFDRVFEKVTNTIIPMKQLQTDMKLLSMALTWNNYLINGDHATDGDGIEGLNKRVSNMPSRQTVRFAGTGSSAPLDPTASVANGQRFFTKLEEAHVRCNRGQVNAILCNEGTKLGFGRVARYISASGGTFLDVTKDSFDRDIPTYRGAPIIDAGYQKDQTTEVITDTQTADDAGADSTSLYFTSFNSEQGVIGIQLSDMEVYDPLNGGEQESIPAKLLRIDWWNGLASFGSYGIVRAMNLEAPADWTA